MGEKTFSLFKIATNIREAIRKMIQLNVIRADRRGPDENSKRQI